MAVVTGQVAGAAIIGGGFYGCAIAIHLARRHRLGDVVLFESEPVLMRRASYNNQARIHNGYHYPRSFTTANRSRVNLPRFVRDWPSAVRRDFAKLYAIARSNSKVTAGQFRRFCHEIGAPLEPADESHRMLFEQRLVEDVFLAQEYVFDAAALAEQVVGELEDCGVRIECGTRVEKIVSSGHRSTVVSTVDGSGGQANLETRHVFNCTYSGLNQIGGDFSGTATQLKHELTEMALVEVPAELTGMAVTVMDGPFFSLMPFPARNLHTLSHVRYTPRLPWQDKAGTDPYRRLSDTQRETWYPRMVRDAVRYMPVLAGSRYVDSLFEVKTVLAKNEIDDGRPILFESPPDLPNFVSILGSKIDNIYDVLEKIDEYFGS